MARQKNTEAPARKSQQVSTSISPELFEALEDYRWSVRLQFTDLVRVALQEYSVNHNVEVKTAPAEDSTGE